MAAAEFIVDRADHAVALGVIIALRVSCRAIDLLAIGCEFNIRIAGQGRQAPSVAIGIADDFPWEAALTNAVRRQNIWRNSWRKLAESGPRLGIDIRRRAFGAASADIR